jgi:hypothetical protein
MMSHYDNYLEVLFQTQCKKELRICNKFFMKENTT